MDVSGEQSATQSSSVLKRQLGLQVQTVEQVNAVLASPTTTSTSQLNENNHLTEPPDDEAKGTPISEGIKNLKKNATAQQYNGVCLEVPSSPP